ncbi:MAG TPA: hypothetical protein PLJ33_03020 [Peptococcaceae bacterium]|nr:hypothetical protein [Peptococcaceae bacterium]HPZ71480.1 hypothetical protein [Peptococcaceae bacterium]HQD53814.1 hypothetical protein [Peptococcaceae bacterium]
MAKKCELDENKQCDNCGECNLCDLEPDKICNNCCKCLGDADSRAIKIIGVITDEEKAGRYRKGK